MDDKMGADVVGLELAKTFDEVNHRLLCHSLQGYGVHDQLISWGRSLLVVKVGCSQTIKCTPWPNNCKITKYVYDIVLVIARIVCTCLTQYVATALRRWQCGQQHKLQNKNKLYALRTSNC